MGEFGRHAADLLSLTMVHQATEGNAVYTDPDGVETTVTVIVIHDGGDDQLRETDRSNVRVRHVQFQRSELPKFAVESFKRGTFTLLEDSGGNTTWKIKRVDVDGPAAATAVCYRRDQTSAGLGDRYGQEPNV